MSQIEFNKKGETDDYSYKKKEVEKLAKKELLLELSIFITSGNVPTNDIIIEEYSPDNKSENMMRKDILQSTVRSDDNNDQNKVENGKKSVISYSRRAIETKTGTIHDFVNILATSGGEREQLGSSRD